MPSILELSEAILRSIQAGQFPDAAQAQTWEEARWAIQVHGIAALLHQAGMRGMPEPLAAYCAEQHRLNAERISGLLAELERLRNAFDAGGIEAIPLKGGQLAGHYYPEPGLRPMADLDLLIRPEAEPAALRLLAELGYREKGHTPRHRELSLRSWSQEVVDTRGEHPDNPMSLDLHTAVEEELWGLRYPMTERLWRGWDGERLEPSVLLEHLLVHASFDMRVGKMRWMQLQDIALVGRRLEPGRWDDLLEHAASLALERFLWAPLALAERCLGRIAPAPMLERLERASPPALRSMVQRSAVSRFSYCNPAPLPFSDKLAWYRPGLEWFRAARAMALPTPRELRQWFPRRGHWHQLPAHYLRYGARAVGWWLNRLRGGRRRAWPHQDS